MEIEFLNKKEYKIVSAGLSAMKKEYNKQADKIMQRLNELLAAPFLSTISHLPPPKCHELKGNFKGCFSVNIDAKYRMIFKPNYSQNDLPLDSNGGIDLTRVSKIKILFLKTNITHE